MAEVMEEGARRSERKSEQFYVTYEVQNHQLNHLPLADLKKLKLLGFRVVSEIYRKTSPITLTVFLIKYFPHTQIY